MKMSVETRLHLVLNMEQLKIKYYSLIVQTAINL